MRWKRYLGLLCFSPGGAPPTLCSRWPCLSRRMAGRRLPVSPAPCFPVFGPALLRYHCWTRQVTP